MKKRVFSLRLDDDTIHRLVAIALRNRVSTGHLIRESLRAQYGVEPPGHALAEALADAAAPWLNGQGG